MDSTVGLVISCVGNPGKLSKKHTNHFFAEADKNIVDTATNTILYDFQKPLCLYKELVELFSKPGDWIFSGPTGIGMKIKTDITLHAFMYVHTMKNVCVYVLVLPRYIDKLIVSI